MVVLANGQCVGSKVLHCFVGNLNLTKHEVVKGPLP